MTANLLEENTGRFPEPIYRTDNVWCASHVPPVRWRKDAGGTEGHPSQFWEKRLQVFSLLETSASGIGAGAPARRRPESKRVFFAESIGFAQAIVI
jgi:hypothetical protein